VSSNLPEFPPETSPWSTSPPGVETQFKAPGPARREWILAAGLFCVTLLSTSFAGLFYFFGDMGFFSATRLTLSRPGLILQGLAFSVPLIVILLAHEMGHFMACRYYGVHCTPPYFVPAPISIAGTLGAFIKIKSPFRHKRALFDIGIAGPLAGFAFVLPALWIGLALSRIVPKGSISGGLSFGEPLILRLSARLLLGYVPASQDLLVHPIAMAAWFGLLATSLNLLPIWQLDGGHIAYAVFGRSAQRRISIGAAVALVLLSFLGWPTPSYLLFALLLLVIGLRVRFYHPSTLRDEEELGPGRIFLGLIAAAILILSFIPVPISLG